MLDDEQSNLIEELRKENEQLKLQLKNSVQKCRWCGSREHDTDVCPAHYEPDYY